MLIKKDHTFVAIKTEYIVQLIWHTTTVVSENIAPYKLLFLIKFFHKSTTYISKKINFLHFHKNDFAHQYKGDTMYHTCLFLLTKK